MLTDAQARSARVDPRMSQVAKSILEQAAAVRHKTVSEFMLENSLSAAYDTLADHRFFALDDEQWTKFNALLDASPADNPGLARLAALTPSWDV